MAASKEEHKNRYERETFSSGMNPMMGFIEQGHHACIGARSVWRRTAAQSNEITLLALLAILISRSCCITRFAAFMRLE
jgi:hypothetical protein